MALPVHCVFCFETLTAKLDHRQAPSLHQVQALWDQYTATQLGELETEEEVEEEDDDGEEPDEEPIRSPAFHARLNRLTVPSPASGSSSSAHSSMSTPSSRTPASTIASSTNSSNSSFFSIGRRTERHGRTTEHDRPLFVTWSTLGRTGSKTLRGCIGTFEAQELESGLRNYALTSAFEDSRFMPISKREVRSLEVGVTLLTDFESAPTATSWELGKHGLRISFTHHSRRYGATYLPDVPVEQGWSKEETLISLMRKAGWMGRKEEWRKVGELKVVRYQGEKVVMGYEEWMTWRRWGESQGLL